MSDSSDNESDTDVGFNSAAALVERHQTKLSSTDLLELYALYKQSTVGKCDIPKPFIFQVLARSKWNAWNAVGNLDQREAKRLYVEKVSRLHPILKEEDKENKQKTGWVVHSVCSIEDEEQVEEKKKNAFYYVKMNDITGLRRVFKMQTMDDLEEESGMGLVHWATDRNACELLEFLLYSGANVNLRDRDGQTCLHYAASCGHLESVQVLIKFNADKTLRDNGGTLPLEVAEDEEIRKLLKC